MDQLELQVEMMKHPLFQHNIGFSERTRIQGEISADEELEIIDKVMSDIMKLLVDVRVSNTDLLPVYFMKLINKRKKELQK